MDESTIYTSIYSDNTFQKMETTTQKKVLKSTLDITIHTRRKKRTNQENKILRCNFQLENFADSKDNIRLN